MDATIRQRLAQELSGRGIEFGPGCQPLPLGPAVTESYYCDAHDRQSFARLFPELGDQADRFPERIDYRLHFDRDDFVDRLGPLAWDFVIANHVLEHLVNPIRFLEQCRAILKPGGLLYLGLPDKRAIFDRYRQRTALADLIDRYDHHEIALSDERIADFLQGVSPGRPPADAAECERHRQRSIHVNVWILDDIVELFQYLGRDKNMPWSLHDGAIAADEFVLLFRKATTPAVLDAYPLTLSRMYAEAVTDALTRRLDHLTASMFGHLADLREFAAEGVGFVRGVKKVAGVVPGSGAVRRWVHRSR